MEVDRDKTVLGQASGWTAFAGTSSKFEGFRSKRWILYGIFQAKGTSKKSRPPFGNFRPLPRSPSRSFAKLGWLEDCLEREVCVCVRVRVHVWHPETEERCVPGSV